MEPLVYQGHLVPQVHSVNQDPEERRVTVVNSVFQEQLGKSKTRKTPTFSPACSLTLLHPLRVLGVTKDRRVQPGRLGWQGFQAPWDRLDLQDPPGHQGHHTALAMVTRKGVR